MLRPCPHPPNEEQTRTDTENFPASLAKNEEQAKSDTESFLVSPEKIE